MLKINEKDLKDAFIDFYNYNVKKVIIINPSYGKPGEIKLINTIYNIDDYFNIEDTLEDYDKTIIQTYLHTKDFNRLNNFIQTRKFRTFIKGELAIYEAH